MFDLELKAWHLSLRQWTDYSLNLKFVLKIQYTKSDNFLIFYVSPAVFTRGELVFIFYLAFNCIIYFSNDRVTFETCVNNSYIF